MSERSFYHCYSIWKATVNIHPWLSYLHYRFITACIPVLCESCETVQHGLIQDERDKEYSAIAICTSPAGNSKKGPFLKVVRNLEATTLRCFMFTCLLGCYVSFLRKLNPALANK